MSTQEDPSPVGALPSELQEALSKGAGPRVARFALAALSGAIPYVGGLIGAAAGAWSEQEQDRFNRIFTTWLKLQEEEIKEIGQTIIEIMVRLDLQDERVRERIESPAYLKLLKKSFRDWSAAESEEKRVLIRNLLSNAAATIITSDDVVRMFIEWIARYSEAHFAVIKHIYQNPGSTRYQMWIGIHGDQVREDSAEADLFKLLIDDLSTGHVIRQHREVDYEGNFVKGAASRRTRSRTYKSAFDDEKEYELTELGRQFISYAMNELVPRIGSGERTPDSPA